MDYVTQIEKSLTLSVCRGWDREFLESILLQIERGRSLSSKQRETLTKVLLRNGEEAQTLHDEWEHEYEKSHRKIAKVVAAYYTSTPYYTAMAKEILLDKIPERLSFLRMMDNKYAQKILNEYEAPARFSTGNHVTGRSMLNSTRVEFADIDWHIRKETFMKFMKNGGFVMEVCSAIHSAAKGAKRYRILPIGATIPIVVEERFLKTKRN